MSKSNKTNYGKETKRILKVSTNVGGFVAKLATKNLLGISHKEKNAEELMQLLGNLKGPIMKVAQILSTIPEAIPEEYAKKLSMLQAEAPSMGWLFVKRRMRAELGDDWQKKFIKFDKNAIKAASLGQVHQATEKKRNLLACKLQYPDMLSSISADLKQLKLILKIYKQIESTINTEDIYQELKERLFEEADYINEFKNIMIYQNIFKKNKNIVIPSPYKELSTAKLLTMEWLEGKALSHFYSSNKTIRNRISENLFNAWYFPFYKFGVIHGDPHPGNYTIGENGNKLNLLDFGCIRVFNPNFVGGVIRLYRALLNDNKDEAAKAYKSWGFKNLNSNLVNALNVWALYLYGPLLEDKIRKIQDHQGATYAKELLGKVRKDLKKFGGVKPPREFVLVDRAAIGLGSVFMHLKSELNWHEKFEALIKNFNEKNVLLAQKKALQ
ncbi:MAG: ABC transporter ATP-binding protein [Rickettsiales bacterium]|nr:ABC transporter ATP-binding protein [Rickettsiales bacterium]